MLRKLSVQGQRWRVSTHKKSEKSFKALLALFVDWREKYSYRKSWRRYEVRTSSRWESLIWKNKLSNWNILGWKILKRHQYLTSDG